MDSRRGPAGAALRLNALLEAAMPMVTPTGVVLGFLFPDLFVRLRPYIPWLFAGITLAGSLKLRARDLGAAAASPVPVLGFFAAAHVLMPVIALAASRMVLPGDMEAAAGFVLLFSAPTAVAGFIWVSIYRGDEALALALILLDTLAAPFVLPFSVSALLGTGIRLDWEAMAVSLALMVVLPTVLGVALNEASRGRIPRAVRPYLAPLSKILLALVIAANSAAVAPSVDFSETRVWAVGAAGIGLTSTAFLLGKALGLVPGIGHARRRGLVFTVGLRNISAVATIAVTFFPEAAALPAVLGMFFQQTLAAVFGRILLGKGRKP
jgi:predicted Na+-dependent transporter